MTNLAIWTLKVWSFGRQKFGHLDVKKFGHLDVKKFGHLDVKKFGHLDVQSDVISTSKVRS